MKRGWALSLGICAALAGCASTPQPSAFVEPSAAQATATPSPTVVSSQAPVTASMPAADGRPMLWPTTLPVASGGETDQFIGFVDVHGALVIPERYDNYEYCRDGHGRATALIASRPGRRAEIFDLSGRLIRRAPTPWAQCAGSDAVIFAENVDAETGKRDDAVMVVATGAVVVPAVADRHIASIDSRTVNVSDPSGEYLLDLVNHHRTPHPGWLAGLSEGSDPRLLVASSGSKRSTDGTGPFGVLDRSGRWVIPPKYDDIGGFFAGHAVVRDGERYRFLEASTGTLGPAWDAVDTVWSERTDDRMLGYLVASGENQSLLAADTRPVAGPTTATIACDWRAGGACSVIPVGGTGSTVQMPEGRTRPLPAGATRMVSPALAADGAVGEDDMSQHLFSLVNGRVIDLPGPSSCEGVGAGWVQCTTRTGLPQTLVVDAAGVAAPFADIAPVPSPVTGTGPVYYWVTAGRYRGFVDADGTWRYRDRRFIRLED